MLDWKACDVFSLSHGWYTDHVSFCCVNSDISELFMLYYQGFSLEDATGLSVKGDVDVHSIFAASLPTSHPSFAPQMHIELLPQWKAPLLLHVNVELFIGILSAGNHFAERMAVRKSWMQHKLVKSSNVVARFFVALVRVMHLPYPPRTI